MAHEDKQAQTAVEETRETVADTAGMPPAGPHAKARLTDESKTPGAGTLPETEDDSVTPGAG